MQCKGVFRFNSEVCNHVEIGHKQRTFERSW